MDSAAESPPTKPRAWWSISVRAMLLLVLAFGVPMGWWARQAQLQHRAVAMIESANGSVVYDHEVLKRVQDASVDTLTCVGERRQLVESFKRRGLGPPPEVTSSSPGQSDPWRDRAIWASELLGVDFVDNVVQVVAIGAKPGESFDPARLADLPKLERINLQLKSMKDEDLAHLAGLRRLRALCLANNKITDAGLIHLGKLDHLEDLILTHNGAITDAGLAHLEGLKSLRILEIGGPKITDAGLARLRGLTELRSLLLSDAPNVTPGGIAELGRALPRLKIRHPSAR